MSVIFNEIGGANVIESSTAPTLRENGTALQDGDIWLKRTDNGIPGTSGYWLWRVTQADPLVAYWVRLDPVIINMGCESGSGNLTFNSIANVFPGFYNQTTISDSISPYLLFDSIKGVGKASTGNASNYYSIAIRLYKQPYLANSSVGGALTWFGGLDGSQPELRVNSSSYMYFEKVMNIIPSYGGNTVWRGGAIALNIIPTGSPGLLNSSLHVVLREIHP